MLYLPHGWTHEALMSKGPRLIARSRQAKMWMRRMLRHRNFHAQRHQTVNPGTYKSFIETRKAQIKVQHVVLCVKGSNRPILM